MQIMQVRDLFQVWGGMAQGIVMQASLGLLILGMGSLIGGNSQQVQEM
jgi:uncharacterized membrane protein YedE/YeeE